MTELLTATDHAGWYEWASVYLAHAFIGLFLVALVAAVLDWWAGDWIDGIGVVALVMVTALYGLVWETGVQGLAAGVPDAALDTAAVALGGLAGASAWARNGMTLAGALVASAGLLVAGIARRR
jgi:hypothetical protein